MKFKQWQCTDAGSDYCPCSLAETNECITCSHLQGENYCDCNWPGVCIFQDFYFSENRKKEMRKTQEFPIVEQKLFKNAIVLSILVTKYLASTLKHPGSYILIRNKCDESYFDIPISILDCDEDNLIIKIAIEVRGIKTKKLLDLGQTILIKGPFWNGLTGIDNLKRTQDEKCLVIVRGIAQAPSILAIKHLLKNNNKVDILVNKRDYEHNFIKDYFPMNLIKEVDISSDELVNVARELIAKDNYRLVFLGGSDSLQNKIIKSVEDLNQIVFLRTNNSVICCGEGICGACAKKVEGGFWIRTCKAQRVD